MIKKILVPALLFTLCSCVNKAGHRPQIVNNNKSAPQKLDEHSGSFSNDELPDYVEMDGRIYRIRSMGSKKQKEGESDSHYEPQEKEEELHYRSKRRITLIESEKVPEHVVNFSRSNIAPISEFDRVAMQMVGKYVPNSFRHDRIYHGYMKFFEREWARLEQNSLGHVLTWAANNIAPRIPSTYETLFYPFGGPDIAYALAFYPNAPEYVLVGLEPIGRFKDISKAMQDPANFEQIKQSLSTYLRGGYFITSEMGKNLWDRWLRGTMYLILLELAACNFEISNVEEIGIDRGGNEVIRRDFDNDVIYCAKITCRKRGEQNWRHVYYIRADLADSNKKLPNLFNFMNKRKFNTMLKSASYAIWDRTLAKMRRFVLQNSKSILQDDTGVPFDCYRKGWERYAFGGYTEPTLSVFKKTYKQPCMAEYFKKHMLATIPFKIGYGFYQSRPNLLLAVPKTGEVRSIDRDFGSSNKIQKKAKEKVIDKADIMKQVEELKDLKLQYKKDENCENCEDKKKNDADTAKNVAKEKPEEQPKITAKNVENAENTETNEHKNEAKSKDQKEDRKTDEGAVAPQVPTRSPTPVAVDEQLENSKAENEVEPAAVSEESKPVEQDAKAENENGNEEDIEEALQKRLEQV